ncbi:Uncharacterised protein [Leclercia adecarboxylata]|uniref:Uncharacterized protein n=1 Tax=Leclercia adecarboxylata TaxID=83655 RepID=A0A4U9HFE1_9ENTR|nr:Uncharacterised protein [Leclercia adecarboxylata]
MRADSGIQRGNRLIGENDFGFLHQRPGNRHALLLSTGQGGDALVGEVGHPDAGQRLQRFLFLRGGEPAQAGAPEWVLPSAPISTFSSTVRRFTRLNCWKM